MKTCTKCGVIKPTEEFGIRRRAADGRNCSCLACSRARRRLWNATEHGKECNRRNRLKWKYEHRLQWLAHKRVEKAIMYGRLSACPCEVCGEVNAVAHHDDYTKPLSVRWLCHVHHQEWHSNNTPVVPIERSHSDATNTDEG